MKEVNDLNLTEIKAPQTAWGFTVKMLGKAHPSLEDYYEVMHRFRKFGDVQMMTEEYDSKNKLHIHGIVLLPKKGFYRRKLMVHGFHIKLEEIYDRRGWIHYITKDQRFQQAFADVMPMLNINADLNADLNANLDADLNAERQCCKPDVTDVNAAQLGDLYLFGDDYS